MARYIISIDQSTQGTKALLFNEGACLQARADRPHRQIISEEGYISHDPEEIYRNVLLVVKQVLDETGVSPDEVACLGISNQRETTVAWNRRTGKPLCHAIVWQCARAKGICAEFEESVRACIHRHTGIPLSPYFPGAKGAWILQNVEGAKTAMQRGELCIGTIDSWLLYKLTNHKIFKTDYSNASRTQLFNIHTLEWDRVICGAFGIPLETLPQVCDSNSCFGYTTMGGVFSTGVPIHAMIGDSHGALFGQGCHQKGMVKATYGTGSSLMMQVGDVCIQSSHGLMSSLAWGMDGKVQYVLEGNLNYTGAVITWLKEDLGLISSAAESQTLAASANPEDGTYLVPAFSGLGAPYWKSDAKAMFYGMGRTTGRAELVRAALESIAYQITDLVRAMEEDSGMKIAHLRVDGGPTRNAYLMQLQSDLMDGAVDVPNQEELSGIGAAYMAGITTGLFLKETAFGSLRYTTYRRQMDEETRQRKYAGWLEAVKMLLG